MHYFFLVILNNSIYIIYAQKLNKTNKYQNKCKKCGKKDFYIFSYLNKNIEMKSKGKNGKW